MCDTSRPVLNARAVGHQDRVARLRCSLNASFSNWRLAHEHRRGPRRAHLRCRHLGGRHVCDLCLPAPRARHARSAATPAAERVTFQKFFPWVWVAILFLLASGYWMLFTRFGGFAGAGLHIHLMQMIGWLMIALFVWLFHGPWLSFKRAVNSEDWPSAGAGLSRIAR